MALVGDDCYFFLNSTCIKRDACPFRHVNAAKIATTTCTLWRVGRCLRPGCKYRHSEIVASTMFDRSQIPCYWEMQPTGCMKPMCMFKHFKPRPPIPGTVLPDSVGNQGQQTDSQSDSSKSVDKPAQPLIEPVIVNTKISESEDSNCWSPHKQSPRKEVRNTSVPEAPTENISQGTEEAEDKKYRKDDETTEGRASESSDKNEETLDSKVKNGKKKAGGKKKKGTLKKKVTEKKTVNKAIKSEKKTAVKPKTAPKKDTASKQYKKKNNQEKVSVKERLGKPKQAQTKLVKEDSESDSDDSVEKLKIMTVEEIYRQKALESMMKRRAAEGKSVHHLLKNEKKGKDEDEKQESGEEQGSEGVSEDSDSSDEEKEEMDSEEDEDESEKKEESEDSSESDDSSEEEEEFEEPDVRRVVVTVDDEKPARKKAKVGLKKQKQQSVLNKTRSGKVTKKKLAGKGLKKRSIIERKPISVKERLGIPKAGSPAPRPSIRERLGKGKAVQPLEADEVEREDVAGMIPKRKKAALQRTMSPKRERSDVRERSNVRERGDARERGDVRELRALSSDDDDDDDDDDTRGSSGDDLATVKVKTLEEIRREKMMKQEKESADAVPVKQRLGLSTRQTIENQEGRKVLLINEPKKMDDVEDEATTLSSHVKVESPTKRRPWRPRRKQHLDDPDEHCQTSEGNVDYDSELQSYIASREDDDDSFEQMRKRALLKKQEKMKSMKISRILGEEEPEVLDEPAMTRTIVQEDVGEEVDQDVDDSQTEPRGETGKKRHKHKHKKESKKKREKRERQIYMPPALKNTAAVAPVSAEPPPPTPESGARPQVMPTRRVNPVARAWADRLTGVSVIHSPPRASRGSPPPPSLSPPRAKTVVEPVAKPESNKSDGGVTIKSFSEIMAEKRRRRQEQLREQKCGNKSSDPASGDNQLLSLSSLPPSLSGTGSKPRVPISPIVFGAKGESSRPSGAVNPLTLGGMPTISIRSASSSSASNPVVDTPKHNRLKRNLPAVGEGKSSISLKSLSNSAAAAAAASSDRGGHSIDDAPRSISRINTLPVSSDADDSLLSLDLDASDTGAVKETPKLTESADSKGNPSRNVSSSTTKHRSGSGSAEHRASVDSEPLKKKSRQSVDDDFSFLDNAEDDIVLDADENIDTLLQDIDDLLA